MKKLLIGCILLMLALPLAFAVNIDSQTQSQIETMDTPTGAEFRLLQLEKAIEAQIILGNQAIAHVESRTTAETNVLEQLVVELELILSEVQNTNVEASAEISAAAFVEYKQSARAIVNAFKTEINTLTEAQARAEIRAEAKAEISSSSRIALLQSEIRTARDEANKERAIKIATRAGLSADSIAKIESSSSASVRISLLSELRNARAEVRQNAEVEVNKAQTRRATIKSAVDARTAGLDERVDARVNSALAVRIGSDSRIGVSIGSQERASNSQEEAESSARVESNTSVGVGNTVNADIGARGTFS